jgi:site-specific recombinase XerC
MARFVRFDLAAAPARGSGPPASASASPAGLPIDLVLYCARHGFGTEMYRATKNLFAVMNVMGHTTVSATMKYHHQNIDEVASRRVQ